MKKIFFFFFFQSLIAACIGQNCKDSFSGTKALYVPQQLSYTKPPLGYKPVFINYVGRHGARHLTKDVNSFFVFSFLQKADSLESLTEDGKKLKQMMLLLESIEKKNNKSISYEGISEIEGIADRMFQNNKEVFDVKYPLTSVMVTPEKRTSQTATAFLNSLKKKTGIQNNIPQNINDTLLRFFDFSPAYTKFEEEGNWKQTFLQLRKIKNYDSLLLQISSRFFKKDFLSTIKNEDLDKFVTDIFGFVTIIPSIKKEIQEKGYDLKGMNFQSFFTCDELNILGKIDAAEDFLLKGPGTDNSGIQTKISAPLLVNFIVTTDSFIKNKQSSLKLRFAHAETIAPFAAFLNINNASQSCTDISVFTQSWKAEEIVPLSANIQWILYEKKGSKDYLLRVLLNEKEVSIRGITTKAFPYYSWNEIKNFYIHKLQDLNLNIHSSNLYQYLLQVQ